VSEALERWNRLPLEEAATELLSSCGSRAWAAQVAGLRPFSTPEDLFSAADRVWQQLTPDDWMEAFRSHPRIGERHAEKATTAASAAWSAAEQKNVQGAGAEVRREIEEGNRIYEERFHRIFIVCASGRQPEKILAILKQRLKNDDATELLESAAQQAQILQLRLRKWLGQQEAV
jgi:2-oxo-4-hydroxy-4-carboxy-5-ureidoimidazoline decarboxylase